MQRPVSTEASSAGGRLLTPTKTTRRPCGRRVVVAIELSDECLQTSQNLEDVGRQHKLFVDLGDRVVDEICTLLASDSVRASLAIKPIGSVTAKNDVVSSATEHRIVPITANYDVVSGTDIDAVVSVAAMNVVVAAKRHDRIVAVAAVDRVIASTRVDEVIAMIATN